MIPQTHAVHGRCIVSWTFNLLCRQCLFCRQDGSRKRLSRNGV